MLCDDRYWVWVSLDYATYGFEVEGERVKMAAPIARWMVGKPVEEVVAWLYKRGPKVSLVRLDV